MGRTVFRQADGTFTTNRAAAVRVAPALVASTWSNYSDLSARLVVGSAKHETNYTVNERTEADQSDGTPSDGLMQIADSEKRRLGMADRDLFVLDDNLEVYAALMDQHRKKFRQLAPDSAGSLAELFYLALAHNQGEGAMIKTISSFGVDVNRYVSANGATVKPGFNGPAIVAYYQDAETGGPDYDPAWDNLVASGGFPGGGAGGAVAAVGLGIGAALALRWLATHGYI